MLFFPKVDEDLQYFRSQGYTGSINDMHFKAMGDLGYTGSLSDRIHSFLVSEYGSFYESMRDLRNTTASFVALRYGVDAIQPELVLDFGEEYYRVDGGKTTLTSAVTHSRASNATMVDSTGTLVTVGNDVPRVGHHIYDGTAWVNEGILHESSAATNLLLNSETIGQKDVDVTAQEYTLSFQSGKKVLSEISETLAVTAVDTFVYDTTNDSDGGAWRKRTQATSWYNEALNTATRGSRKEFPAVAVIVAEAAKVTIYDGDDPDLPMWMVFTDALGYHNHIGTPSSVDAVNGSIAIGKGIQGLTLLRFISDDAFRYKQYTGYTGVSSDNIAARNTANTWTGTGDLLVQSDVNDVAMTVLPNAPIDAATGLPVPTIAVATEGGVSVIKDDGTVVDIIGYSQPPSNIDFDGDGNLVTEGVWNSEVVVMAIPTADSTVATFIYEYLSTTNTSATPSPRLLGNNTPYNRIDGASSTGSGVTLFDRELVAYTTSDYNTGWMNGDIKLATLSDTDDTDLVGAELATASGQSGTITDVSTPWASVESHGQASIATDVITWTGTTTWESLRRDMSMVAGKSYVVELDVVRTSGSLVVFQDHSDIVISISATGSYNITLSPTGASANGIQFSSSTFVGTVELISVRLAEADRSVNNNGLQVHGTVTKTPVATGADLVAYSGFSASNYLEQPYNSDLDFGTGDFCVMGWVKPVTGNKSLLARQDFGTTGFGNSGYLITQTVGLVPRLKVNGTALISTTTLSSGVWAHVCFVRSGGVSTIYVNGVASGSSASLGADVSNTSGRLLVGVLQWDGNIHDAGNTLALFRISATAPTASQITKIYNDEKVLFQENAQATLYGTSDAVTALAHDDTTDLLHVGTSAGRSVFDGLRRIDNTTTAVTTAISASGGFILEQ